MRADGSHEIQIVTTGAPSSSAASTAKKHRARDRQERKRCGFGGDDGEGVGVGRGYPPELNEYAGSEPKAGEGLVAPGRGGDAEVRAGHVALWHGNDSVAKDAD